MPYDTLPEFIQALDKAGELRRIKTAVDPVLEVAEIADRVSKAPGSGGIMRAARGSVWWGCAKAWSWGGESGAVV